ncbi:4-hydroxy-tetrahydrodipicolinate synthase [Bradyrhizobium sp. NFR13]|jgi:4-hydroxy-tetrahydrodipicolinate synthase|uniref:dihydrodipicolinate synthase family protein n=1 Tax=Bradyrhizobium sp. NFR13 TaxID=1566285 RepID=UPI0008E667E2|nr:dihydrodipicolinate synthase family protein [Bradyrhizobium sp. NFR13]SFL56442.1 4-hydroxy-tetrahydrodipicolinate synthase [Bradyrhizobium sp. NFR13]
MTAPFPAGVFCAATTPFNADLTVDQGLFTSHCQRLLDNGCTGIAMLGTTGEANSLSSRERMALLEAVVKSGIAPSKLLPGTGVASIMETVELTKHAVTNGVGAVVMLPPFYYKGVSDDGIVDAYTAVIERVNDPRLRVVLYHIPQMSAVPISLDVIDRLRKRFPEIVVGIKDSAGEFSNMKAIVERFPGFSVLVGADPLMLKLLPLGGAGCITAASNLVSRELATVFNGFNDPAKQAEVAAAQERIVATRNAVSTYVQLPSLKVLLAKRDNNDGWLRVRPPLTGLSASEAAKVRESLTV